MSSRALRPAQALLALMVCWLSVSAVLAGEPIDLVPADSLLCWYARPAAHDVPEDETLPDGRGSGRQAADANAGGKPNAAGGKLPSGDVRGQSAGGTGAARDESAASLASLINRGSRLIGRPIEGQVLLWARVLEAFRVVTRYPYAIAVLDARAKPLAADNDAKQLDRLELAVIVRTGGASEPLLRTIQTIVNEQVDAGTAALRTERAGDWTFQVLRDRRLPDWVEIAWGSMGEHFVVTVGDGVWNEIAETAARRRPSVSADAWYAEARAPRGGRSIIEVFAGLAAIRARLDPFVDGRASAFLRVWDADRIEKSHWAVGFEERGLFCEARFRSDGRDLLRTFADPSFVRPELASTIPATARYAVFRIKAGDVLGDLSASLLATRSEPMQRIILRHWERICRDGGFDPQRDLLANFGRHVVIHDDPPHPLHVPLATTILLEIQRDPQRIRAALDGLFSGWEATLANLSDPDPAAAPRLVYLRRDGDGVWYVQIGFFLGPAWTVSDRFVIASWSPAALREYMERVGDAAGKPVSR